MIQRTVQVRQHTRLYGSNWPRRCLAAVCMTWRVSRIAWSLAPRSTFTCSMCCHVTSLCFRASCTLLQMDPASRPTALLWRHSGAASANTSALQQGRHRCSGRQHLHGRRLQVWSTSPPWSPFARKRQQRLPQLQPASRQPPTQMQQPPLPCFWQHPLGICQHSWQHLGSRTYFHVLQTGRALCAAARQGDAAPRAGGAGQARTRARTEAVCRQGELGVVSSCGLQEEGAIDSWV